MTSSAKQIHALCGRTFGKGPYRVPFGKLTCGDWDADPFGKGGFRGLPWGVGDPEAAGLDSADWRVVRIEDEEGPIPIPAAPGASPPVAAVKFRSCTVLYVGSPRGALETLMRLGADPERMAAELVVQNELGVAHAGDYGVAIAGQGGHARTGAHGHAFVETTEGGALAVAIAGRHGRARLEGDDGLAIVDSYGLAVGQRAGIAIARGVGAKALSGDGGLAVAMGPARWLSAGNGATALALRRVGHIEVGADATAIVMDAKEGQTLIRGRHGARFILCLRGRDGGDPHFTIGLVGPGGLKPEADYVWSDGEFREAAEMIDLTREAFVEPDPEWLLSREPPDEAAPVPDNAEPPAGGPFGDDTIVLCQHREEWPRSGPVHAEILDPNATPLPILGLAWGDGDPAAARFQSHTTSWALMRVADPVLIPSPANPRAVSFETGEIIESGSLRDVVGTLRRLGGGHQRTGRVTPGANGAIVHAGDVGVATAPSSGWAFAGWNGGAYAGDNGFARAGCNGVAYCGVGGIAIADEEGNAETEDHGVAVSEGKRYGTARAGYGGVAIGLERYKIAEAGDHGAAIARLGVARTGEEGIAIGRNVHAGRGGVAVGTERLSGERGALLVAYPSFHHAVVGRDGIEPGRQYVLKKGRFCPPDERDWDEDPLKA